MGDPRDFETSILDDDQLRAAIKRNQHEIDGLEAQIEGLKGGITYYQAELRRREIDAFFDANEGLRLAVGDKLLGVEDGIGYVGEETTITGFEFNHPTHIICTDLYSLKLPLDIARRMREAYLASVQEAQG